MLNFAVERERLDPFVPRGTELDWHEGRTFVSVVGFRFLRTRIRGVPVPLHINFTEVNLRFYVRRKTEEGWRRGVVFIRELVPRRAIAFVARAFYGEPYLALPMRHQIEHGESSIRAEYAWRRSGRWESIVASASGEAREIKAGSEEEFITEHYWGYTSRRGGCNEYEVEHPRWRVWRADEAKLEADIAGLYGESFVECLSAKPTSAFIADGSGVVVRGKARAICD